jgi:hypothetical protein
MISSRSVSGATIRCHSDYDGDDAATVCIDKHQVDNREGPNPITHNDSWRIDMHQHGRRRKVSETCVYQATANY